MKRTKPLFLATLLGLSLLVLAACGGNSNKLPYLETFDEPGEWSNGNDGDVQGLIENGVFNMKVTADSALIWSTANKDFGDGIYQVEATATEGPLNNGYGLLLRADNEKQNFYLFEISADGYVWIGRYRSGGAEEAQTLVGDWWFESTAVKQGLNQTNILKVRAEAGNFIFYLNDQEVGRFSDNAFANGDIGVMVETLGGGGVNVQFDNFRVDPLQ